MACNTFHYALHSDGFLMLGTAESIGTYGELFEPVDNKHRLYVRTGAPSRRSKIQTCATD